jgi:exopolysaccharide biosynthesis polyprenyl glycosylphosphotransferase
VARATQVLGATLRQTALETRFRSSNPLQTVFIYFGTLGKGRSERAWGPNGHGFTRRSDKKRWPLPPRRDAGRSLSVPDTPRPETISDFTRHGLRSRRVAGRQIGLALRVVAHRRLVGSRSRPGYDRRSPRLRRLLLVSDAAATLLAFAIVISYAGDLESRGGWGANFPLLVIGVPAWLLLTGAQGLYHVGSHSADHGAADEIGPIIMVSVLWTWGLVLTVKLAGLGDLSIASLAWLWLTGVLMMMSFRAATRAWARRQRWYTENVIVIGAGSDVEAIVSKVLRHPEWGLNLVACVEHSDREESLRSIGDVPVVRGDIDVMALIEELQVQRVMVAWSTHFSIEQRFELVRELADRDIHVNLVPSWIEVLGTRLEFRELEGVPLLGVPAVRLSRSSLALKRGVDIALSVAALLVLAPLLLLCAAAIKLDSRGPVFFRQRRIGKGGTPFELHKFRSMVIDADDRKDEVASLNIHGGGNGHGMFKIPRDPRVTRVGTFLRRTSLDEMPQLFNILAGDMSLVGPRPLIENEDRQVSGRFRRRLELTPGITGLWQVSGRSEIPFAQMVNLDYMYVTSWSLWNDLKILIKTIPAVTARRGAY